MVDQQPDRERVDRVVVDEPAVGQPVYDAPVAYGAGGVSESVAVDHVDAARSQFNWISRLIWLLVGILLLIIALRVVFLAADANPDSGFVDRIYAISDPFVKPFQNIFSEPTDDETGARLDTAALLAIVVYIIGTWIVLRVISLMVLRPRSGVSRSASRVDRL